MMETVNGHDVYYGDGETETFSHDIDYYVNSVVSTVYSPQLAHILTAFSYAAYDEGNAIRSMESFGFEHPCSDYNNDMIGYSIGRKKLDDGRTLILVLLRGSTGTTEALSNLNLFETTVLDDTSLHSGFWDAARTVYTSLYFYLNGDCENTVFVFTGHSRGAAASNILAKYLASHNGIDQSCIYSYNIACPDVAAGRNADWDPDGEYDNIFNIANAKDIISLIPGALGNTVFGRGRDSWGKFGRSYWFAENEKDIEIDPAAHEPSVYLAYLRNEYPLETYQSRTDLDIRRMYKVFNLGSGILGKSPVNIRITNESGEEVLSLINGKVNIKTSSSGNKRDDKTDKENTGRKGKAAVSSRKLEQTGSEKSTEF